MTDEVAMIVQCNQCMWIGSEDDLLWVGDDCIRHCPTCNASDETLMDLPEAASYD